MSPVPRYIMSPAEFKYLINQSTTLISIYLHQKKSTSTKMPGSRAPPGAWSGANGPRVLTEAQRQRKRERDRATKREDKAKNQQKLQELEQTKEYAAKRIQELEDEVEYLSKTCTCNRGGSHRAGSSSDPTHNASSLCRPSSQVSYDSSSNIGKNQCQSLI